MSTIELNVVSRDTGKSASSILRKSKMTPAVVYANKAENLYFAFEEKFAMKMKSQRHDNPVFELKSEDKALNGKKAIIKDMAIHPVSRIPTHIDFVFA